MGQTVLTAMHYQTTLCVSPVCTLTKPFGARSEGATSTQRQGEQVRVAKIRNSGKPGFQRFIAAGWYIQVTSAALARNAWASASSASALRAVIRPATSRWIWATTSP